MAHVEPTNELEAFFDTGFASLERLGSQNQKAMAESATIEV